MPCTSLCNVFSKTHKIMVEIAHFQVKYTQIDKTLTHGLQNLDSLVCPSTFAIWWSYSL